MVESFKIYVIRNKVNDKVYIGQTSKTIERRWYQHVHSANLYRKMYICRAIRKYGAESFQIVQLDEAYTQKTANAMEKFYIKVYQSYKSDLGYNCTLGGEGIVLNRPRVITEETRRKLAEAGRRSGKSRREKPISQKSRNNISKAMLGKYSGSKNPMFGKSGKNSPVYGRKHTEDEKLRIAESERKTKAMKF